MSLFSGFPTERWEMEIVASKFERDGLIDYKEFVNSLKDKKPVSSNFTELNLPHVFKGGLSQSHCQRFKNRFLLRGQHSPVVCRKLLHE